MFPSPSCHRFANEAEFVAAMGRLMLGASARAGKAGAKAHMMMRTQGMQLDVRQDSLAALFDKYSQRSRDGEPLVDVEGLYLRMKGAVYGSLGGTESVSLETEAAKLERELSDHTFNGRSMAWGVDRGRVQSRFQ